MKKQLSVASGQSPAKKAKAELERYRRWVADLQSGMYINCVYCGHRYGPYNETPTSRAEVLKKHVEQCPEHPMSKLRQLTIAAWRALKSYEHGNASPDLAEENVQSAGDQLRD